MLAQIIVPMLAGLSIFLFGMKVMELALQLWAGSRINSTLQTFTKTPLRGMLIGTASTALLQSSSAITVITVGFVNAGLLTFPQTLGIVLGTNIGTCLTTEMIGLPLSRLLMPMLLSAAAVWLLSWAFAPSLKLLQPIQCLALAVFGFSCVLLGMEVMQTIVPALQTRGLFAWFVEQSQRSLLWGLLAGAAITAIIQSSTAAIAMTMGMAAAQAIPIELGLAMILGANIGTCATAFLASIGGSRYGQYVAWFHLALNAGGALLFFPFIPLLQEAAAFLSSRPAAQLAHAQTLFNICCSLLALPLCYLPMLRRAKPSL